MTIDVRTVYLILMLLLLSRAAVLLYAWRASPGYPPTRPWALGSLMTAIGAILVGLRDLLPIVVSAWLANLLIIPGWSMIAIGIIRSTGHAPPMRWFVGCVILALLGYSWFFFIDEHYVARTLIGGSVFVLADLVSAFYCLRSRAEHPTTHRVLAGLLIFVVVINVWRLALIVVEGTGSVLTPTAPNIVFLLTLIVYSALSAAIFSILAAQSLQEKIDAKARRDALTGAFNRHAFYEFAQREIDRALRYKTPLSVLMVDIDHFKHVNDTHGHEVGDETLKTLSRHAATVLRPTDIWSRYGGEEFVVLLPETPSDQAYAVGERLRQAIETLEIHAGNTSLRITVSIGVAEFDPSDTGWAKTVTMADQALYQAKHEGRNRVVLKAREN